MDYTQVKAIRILSTSESLVAGVRLNEDSGKYILIHPMQLMQVSPTEMGMGQWMGFVDFDRAAGYEMPVDDVWVVGNVQPGLLQHYQTQIDALENPAPKLVIPEERIVTPDELMSPDSLVMPQ